MLNKDEVERILEDTYDVLKDTDFLLNEVVDKDSNEYKRLLKSKDIDLKIKEKLETQMRMWNIEMARYFTKK